MILGGQTFHTSSSAGFSSPASLSCAGLGRAGPILRGGFRVAGPAGTRRPSARRAPRARARRGSRRDRRSLEGSRHQIVTERVARARGERVSDALGHLAAVSTADTRDAEQAAGLRGIDPARERDPALVGRRANGPRGLVAPRTEAPLSPRAYRAIAAAIAPPPYHRPRDSPAGPTTRIARHVRQRYRRTVTILAPGASPGPSGPSCCRSSTPWPTMPKGPPTGRAGAWQHGQRAGLASTHDGIRSHQDLIPSGLATNLSALRVFSTGREARRRGRARPKTRPLRRLQLALLGAPSTATGRRHHVGAPADRGHAATMRPAPRASASAGGSPRGRTEDAHRAAGRIQAQKRSADGRANTQGRSWCAVTSLRFTTGPLVVRSHLASLHHRAARGAGWLARVHHRAARGAGWLARVHHRAARGARAGRFAPRWGGAWWGARCDGALGSLDFEGAVSLLEHLEDLAGFLGGL